MVAIVKKNKSLEVLESPINAFQPSHTKRGVKCYWRWLSIVDGPMDLTDDETSDDSENNESLALLLPRSSEYKCDPFGAIERCKEERFRQEKAELKSLWNRHLIPDGPWKVAQDQVLLEEKGVKLLKFSFVSVVSILLIHYYALAAHADHDESYGLREMILYDGNHVALDIIVFFVVGRLYETSSVDCLGWAVPSIGAALALSFFASNANSLHHSITAYEIHCTWTWQFWVLILCGACPTIIGLIFAHLVHAARQQTIFQKLLELLLGFSIFLFPYCTNSFFHLHHWYYAWVLGMHANANTWWSRLTMSMMWGIYLNGIAIFGRDPIMNCAVTLYQSQNQQCPFLVDSNFSLTVLESSSPSLDWRSCSNTKGSLLRGG